MGNRVSVVREARQNPQLEDTLQEVPAAGRSGSAAKCEYLRPS